MNAYEEVVDWIAAGRSAEEIASFRASESTNRRVSYLVQKEKDEGLLPDEKSELDHYGQLEHIMRLAKARARLRLANE